MLGEKLDGVEMISIGPEIVDPHAPGEKVRISSTQRSYRLLGALLDDLSRPVSDSGAEGAAVENGDATARSATAPASPPRAARD